MGKRGENMGKRGREAEEAMEGEKMFINNY